MIQQYYTKMDLYCNNRMYELEAFWNIRDANKIWLKQLDSDELDITVIYNIPNTNMIEEKVMNMITKNIINHFNHETYLEQKRREEELNSTELHLDRKGLIMFLRKCADFAIITKAKIRTYATQYVTMTQKELNAFISDHHSKFCRAVRTNYLKSKKHFNVSPHLFLLCHIPIKAYKYIKSFYDIISTKRQQVIIESKLLKAFKKINGVNKGEELASLTMNEFNKHIYRANHMTKVEYFQFWRTIITNNYNAQWIYRLARESLLFYLIYPYSRYNEVVVGNNVSDYIAVQIEAELEWSDYEPTADGENIISDSGTDDDIDQILKENKELDTSQLDMQNRSSIHNNNNEINNPNDQMNVISRAKHHEKTK